MEPTRFVFGPVKSRRLGLSLGVDPLGPKICSFDCLYCEIGPTRIHTLQRRPYQPVSLIEQALRERLAETDLHFEVLTFAGSGEPTLHSDLGRLIETAKSLTDRPVCLLTNSSLLWDKKVRDEVARCDLILPSLDAGREETFRRLNRPVPGLGLAQIVEGLCALREEFAGEIWLEVMLVGGVNDAPEEVEAIAGHVARIRPHRVQLNTVDRPPASPLAKAFPLKRLEELARYFDPPAEVISHEALASRGGDRQPSVSEIISLLAHRPSPSEEIAAALSYDFKETLSLLETLVREKKIKTRVFKRRLYYYV